MTLFLFTTIHAKSSPLYWVRVLLNWIWELDTSSMSKLSERRNFSRIFSDCMKFTIGDSGRLKISKILKTTFPCLKNVILNIFEIFWARNKLQKSLCVGKWLLSQNIWTKAYLGGERGKNPPHKKFLKKIILFLHIYFTWLFPN